MSASTWLLLVQFFSYERSEDHGTIRPEQTSVMRSSQQASGQSKARTVQSDALQRIWCRTHKAHSLGQR